jgi:4-carboxymuconolactone decarboxylase
VNDDVESLADRDATGAATYEAIMAMPAPPPATLLTSLGVRGFEFGELWNRGGITRKERRLVTIACVAEAGAAELLDAHVYGALQTGDLSIDEMQEVVLHCAVYSGWPKAARLDEAVTAQWERVHTDRGEHPAAVPPPRQPTALTFSERDARGVVVFDEVMTFAPPDPDIPYSEVGVRGFVFGEMWDRPGLTRKERRFLTLACVCAADAVTPIQSHVYAALNSGDVSLDEVREVGLHCAVYSGWPKASFFEAVVRAQWARIESEGGPRA